MTVNEALEVTARKDDNGNPVPFSVHFVTLDRKRSNRPSRHIRWKKAVRCGASHNLRQWDQIGIKPMDGSHSEVSVNVPLILKINGEFVNE